MQGEQNNFDFRNFYANLETQFNQIKEAVRFLAKGQKLSSEDKNFIKNVVIDIARGAILLTLFSLPGGVIAVFVFVGLARQFNIELIPTAFRIKSE